MEVPRVVTDVKWSRQANDWVPVITIGTGDSAVKYYGIRCPHDGSMARIPEDVITAEDRGQRSVGGIGKTAGCKAGGKDRMRRADSRRADETVKAYFVYSCARSLNNIAYTITPYYDDVIGNNTCPAMEMVTDSVLQTVEVVTESSASWKLQEDPSSGSYGEMVLQEEEKPEWRLEIMPMMQRISQMSPAENALMRWRIAGPAKGGDAERWQREMVELRRGKRGTLEAWTLQGKKLATREALRILNTLAADYELRARHYEKERERIERDEKAALRAAERYARRKGFAKEKEEAATKIREIAARKRALEEIHAVVYVPEDPSSERCRKDTARRLAKPGQKVEKPEERLERCYRERQEMALQEMRKRAEERKQKTESGEREVRKCTEPEVMWYKPRRAVGAATAGSLAEAVCVYENTGTASYQQSGVSGPRAAPTAQLTKRADTKSNVVNTVTATPWRTQREPGSRYQEVDGEYEAVLPETKAGKTVDMEQAGMVEVTRYAVLGEPVVKPDLKKAKAKAEKKTSRGGLRSIRSKRRLGADNEDKEEDRDRPAEAPDQFTAVRLTTKHAGNTNWTLAATALGDKVRKGEITEDEANELSTKYAPTMQGSFMFPVISYPVVELNENGQAGPAATRQYIPHLCLGEIGETGEGSDYASTFGDRRVFVDRGSFTSSSDPKTGSVEVIPGKQCEIEKDEATGGVAISFYTKRGNNGKESVLRMPKRGATWCCSCPYAMTEYANTPYQQTNHQVLTTVNNMPTITMGETGDGLGGTAKTEYFSQFINAGLAMYSIGKQEKFWAAVGTTVVSPTALKMTSGNWDEGGFTGWSNVDSTGDSGVLMTGTQIIDIVEYIKTQNVVNELKPVRNSENMWECAWNSRDVSVPVRDYSLAELVADAGSFFGTWLETSNGCDMSGFSGERQALFCSFNIRGGIVANTLIFAGNSFGERLGKGEEPGPGPTPTPTTPDVVVFRCVENCPSMTLNHTYNDNRTIYPTSVTNVSNTSEYLVEVVYEYPGLYEDAGFEVPISFDYEYFMENLVVPDGLTQYGDPVFDYTDISEYMISVKLTYRAYNQTTAKYVWPALTVSGVTVKEHESAEDQSAGLTAEVSNDNVYTWIYPVDGTKYLILLSSLKSKLVDTYDELGLTAVSGSPGSMFIITPEDEWAWREYTGTLPDSTAEITLAVSKPTAHKRKNSTRRHFRNNQPQRVNAAARKWIEDRERKEGEKKSISIKDACRNSKRHLVREGMPQRMSRKEREYVDALKKGERPPMEYSLKAAGPPAWPIVETTTENDFYVTPDGIFAEGYRTVYLPEAAPREWGNPDLTYSVSDLSRSGNTLTFILTAVVEEGEYWRNQYEYSITDKGASTVDQITNYFESYNDLDDVEVVSVQVEQTANASSTVYENYDAGTTTMYYNQFNVSVTFGEGSLPAPESSADNSYGAPVTEITIPARVRGTGKPEEDEPGEGVTIPVSQLVQPILTTSTSLLTKVDPKGLSCRVKRNGAWWNAHSNENGDISLDPNSFSRMSSLRRPHYSQQMTGKWWSLGDVPATFISEWSGYSQIKGAIVGLFTGVIDFFDMEKQVLPASIKVFDQGERDVVIFSPEGDGQNRTFEKAVESKSGKKEAQGVLGESIGGIEDWADPTTNNYEHEGLGVFGRRTAASTQQFSGSLEENRQAARTLVSEKRDGTKFSFTPTRTPLFFWHVSWSVNFASPVANNLRVLQTDIPETEGETYYAKPLFAWTYGIPKTMPNVALMSNIEDETKRYVKTGDDGKEYIDRNMTQASENNVVEFMPSMFGAASLLNVGCDASVDLVVYSTGT